MKKSTTVKFISDFQGLCNHLSLVKRDTQEPIVDLGSDIDWALARTTKKLKGDIELLDEERKKYTEQLKEIADISENKWVPKAGKTQEDIDKLLEEQQKTWEAFLKRPIDIEVHAFKRTDLPQKTGLPKNLKDVLFELVDES